MTYIDAVRVCHIRPVGRVVLLAKQFKAGLYYCAAVAGHEFGDLDGNGLVYGENGDDDNGDLGHGVLSCSAR